MLIYITTQLFIVPIYCGVYLGHLGYHGVFCVILLNLGLSTSIATVELYNTWAYDLEYVVMPAVGVEFANCELVYYGLTSNFLSALVMFIMVAGALFVLTFVYVEMGDDKEGANFAILLLLFLGFMSILVASANLFMFYLGGEGIGLTSLFLISFWSERARAIKATLKVYTINKVGDYLIAAGICLLLIHANSVTFETLNLYVMVLDSYIIHLGTAGVSLVELAALCFVLGGGVKSAQFGFHIWLLEAMEAPLGASALMHSSTLVIAGIVLNYKLCLFIEHAYAATLLLIVGGGWTALFASIIACFQFELKIIMAYSTVSSMGFLYCLLGLHAYDALLKYLVIHAFIKIFFFLTMGAIILHCNGCQDIRGMGGLMNYIPGLYVCYIIGSTSLAGVPYGSGYYCKSSAGTTAITANYQLISLHSILLLTTLFTYVYLMRAGYLIFFGPKNGHRSIYRAKKQSPLVATSLGLLGLGVAYTGSAGYHMCSTVLSATQQSLCSLYDISLQLQPLATPTAWSQLSLVYVTCVIVAAFNLARLTGRSPRALRHYMYNFYITSTALLLYIIL